MLRVLTATFLLIGLATVARAADYYYTPPAKPYTHGDSFHHHAYLPMCDEPKVLARIAQRFAHYDAHVILSGLAVTQVDDIRERGVRTGGPSLIDRRYCTGTAWLSDGRKSEVAYLIEAKQGFASFGWKVESCLPGYDPYRVYGAWCRSVRP